MMYPATVQWVAFRRCMAIPPYYFSLIHAPWLRQLKRKKMVALFLTVTQIDTNSQFCLRLSNG